MEHRCLFCNTPFTAKREGKNYCSNTCRQKAFYRRSAEGTENKTGHSTIQITAYRQESSAPAVLEATVKEEPFYVKTGIPGSTDAGFDKDTITATIHQPTVVNDASVKSTATAPPPDPDTGTFQWTPSRFNDSVEELSERDGNYNMFIAPQLYLNAGDKEKVIWVSIRLRSLLESLLQLHRGCQALCSELVRLRRAFTILQEAPEFRGLPAGYPYKTLVKELEQGLIKITKAYGKNARITVKYSRTRKLEMIAARYNLSALVPKKRPGELFPYKQKEPKHAGTYKRPGRYGMADRPHHLLYRRGYS